MSAEKSYAKSRLPLARKLTAAQVVTAENRARAVLLENEWQLRAGRNPAVIVGEKDDRTL